MQRPYGTFKILESGSFCYHIYRTSKNFEALREVPSKLEKIEVRFHSRSTELHDLSYIKPFPITVKFLVILFIYYKGGVDDENIVILLNKSFA